MGRYKRSLSEHITFVPGDRLYASSPVIGPKLCFQPVPEYNTLARPPPPKLERISLPIHNSMHFW